jgi:hypothetical protein
MGNTVLPVEPESDRGVGQLVQGGAGPERFTEWQKQRG